MVAASENITPDCLLTAKEAAKLYSIHERTFRLWCHERPGWPRPVLIGSKPRWRASDIRKHIASLDTVVA